MKLTGTLLKKGEELASGEFISKDCIINTDKVFDRPVNWNYDHLVPLGSVISIDDLSDPNGLNVEIELNDEGIKFINKINGGSTFGIGGVVREREGNRITKFDLQEVSLISNRK